MLDECSTFLGDCLFLSKGYFFYVMNIYMVDVVGWRSDFLREKVIMAVDDICFL